MFDRVHNGQLPVMCFLKGSTVSDLQESKGCVPHSMGWPSALMRSGSPRKDFGAGCSLQQQLDCWALALDMPSCSLYRPGIQGMSNFGRWTSRPPAGNLQARGSQIQIWYTTVQPWGFTVQRGLWSESVPVPDFFEMQYFGSFPAPLG